MNFIRIFFIISLCFSSSAILAGSKHNKHESSQGFTKYDYAKVIHVIPLYREVRVSNPKTDCWDEPVVHYNEQYGQPKSAGGMVAGGILGGIIGHQIGKGRGNKLATAVGTLIGAQIGHEAVNKGVRRNHSSYTSYEERCETRHQVSYEEVIDGYEVTYRYKGQTYQIEMPYHPGKRIKMRLQFTPVI